MRKIIAVLALVGVFGLTLVASASAHRGAPYRTEAWAEKTLKQRVHYWRGFKIDPSWTTCYGEGDLWNSHYNRNGEEIFKHFHCTMDTPLDYPTDRHFYVTLHTIRYRPYFRLAVGWR